ncbi:Cloroperoxidase [Aaosphaeria arxii CBS 175.79]|uniref:Cloroperoxidase n=1 Tax=Aaosphaeria arxii CBS 175.79 TaxID=1450172 RepID=A0A6A5XSA7_9PLEO|nr:Cloroperoxidase [Aaosphaeria arxii CBS 175.79]KAF2016215.1 Cloroperoxidase [Aaosphaeria arxii CBS 175.79]
MKLSLLTTAQALLLSASAHPQYGTGSHLSWHPPGPNDFRGPCPMMNTLANHGFLPHDGRNITKENAIRGIGAGLNFDADLASLMWEQAIIANPEPNATFFTLDHLNRHNVLEHDASLSRTDAFFGNNHIFNQSVFDTTKSYWTAPLLTAQMLANSKLARQIESRAFNPNYTFSKTTEEFSLGEVAAPVIAFGDMQKGTVDRALVEYFFENERLPEVLGWSKKNQTIGLQDILNVVTIIRNATSLFTGAPGSDDSPHGNNRRDLHAAFLS